MSTKSVPQKSKGETRARANSKQPMEITSQMKSAITQSKKWRKDGASKAEAARKVFELLPKYERRQVVHVLINGCGLSIAGARTYYQNCKSE